MANLHSNYVKQIKNQYWSVPLIAYKFRLIPKLPNVASLKFQYFLFQNSIVRSTTFHAILMINLLPLYRYDIQHI